MVFNNDSKVLEEAYLSVSKKMPRVSADNDEVAMDPNQTVSVGSMEEPAPGVDMNMIDSQVQDVNPEDKDTTGIPVDLTAAVSTSASPENSSWEHEDCEEAHEMSLDNLNSIRESIMKIASCCAAGEYLPAWAHQKLAIAMDNLADIARAMR